ncbi:Crp/Fnr family transcriptional regulator [Dehalobacter sp. 4CP]|uniref:Crp/Fnr family transcriptional regulator n=1 Tax=Dehalobacter sp. CP TaxID=2594474 RepID=UPI0039ED790C|nr:Crp/Fnr family transcriptional regulator [Dehalobacter sp.]
MFSSILGSQRVSKTLIEAGEKVFYKKNTTIASPGEIIDKFYYILKGRVLCIEYSPEGNEKIEFILEDGSIFLESNLLFDVPAFTYFKAVEDSYIIHLSKNKLMELILNNLDISLFIMESLTKKFFSSMSRIEELLFHDVEWRICNLFISMAKSYGIETENMIKLNFKISHQFIGHLLGINRITSIKIIKKLKGMNYIEQIDGYYYIKDLNGLEQYQARKKIK